MSDLRHLGFRRRHSKGTKRELLEEVGLGGRLVSPKYVHRATEDYVKRLGRSIRVQLAILAGSWAKGTYLEDSDVDLIIVLDDFRGMPLPQRLVFLQKQWKNKMPLEAFGYTSTEFRRLRRDSVYVRGAVRYGIPLVYETRVSNEKLKRLLKSSVRLR